MKTLLLNGAPVDDVVAARLTALVCAQLRASGSEPEIIHLRDQKIGNCAGDFFCWIRTPGQCNVDDDNRVLARQLIQSELVIQLTPITFGGYASTLKRMLDHQIQNISPFFTTLNGEVHHQKRYAAYPRLLTIGWQSAPDPEAEAVFRHLVYRNGLNMHTPVNVCGVVTASTPEAELSAAVTAWLAQVARGVSDPQPRAPQTAPTPAGAGPVKRALLLVGSPRTRQSTSAALGDYLLAQLHARGVETEAIQLYTSLNSAPRRQALYAAVDQADLIVLAFPVYVDTLPAPVLTALERLAAHRQAAPTPARLAALANCGFPEAAHTVSALATCAQFARATGLTWLGGLGLGGGEGLVHGAPLNTLGGRAFHIRQALDLAAAALAEGQPIPDQARVGLARPVIPAWLYALMGGWGWRQQARRYNAQDRLRLRPYEALR